MIAVVEVLTMEGGGQKIAFKCPGCGCKHEATIGRKNASGAQWTWNGDVVRPTLSPSYVERVGPWPSHHKRAGQVDVCHSFVRDGQIEFLSDCTHELRGQTVPLPAIGHE